MLSLFNSMQYFVYHRLFSLWGTPKFLICGEVSGINAKSMHHGRSVMF